MSKVIYEALNSANVKVNNSEDLEKSYDISANANISGVSVNSIDAGEVKKNGTSKATFNSWGEGMLNVSYNGVDAEEQCAITTAINAFIADTKEYVKTHSIVTGVN